MLLSVPPVVATVFATKTVLIVVSFSNEQLEMLISKVVPPAVLPTVTVPPDEKSPVVTVGNKTVAVFCEPLTARSHVCL